MNSSPGSFILPMFAVRSIGLAVAYALAAFAGLALATPPGYSSFVFPAAGIAMAAVMVGGYRHCFGVGLGAFVVALTLQRLINPVDTQLQTTTTAIGLAMAAAAQAAIARYLLLRLYGSDLSANRPAKIIGLCLLAGPIACLTSASAATILLVLVDDLNLSGSLFQWFVRWLGDWVGVVLAIPFLVAWATPPIENRWNRVVAIALPMLLGFSASVGTYAFLNHREQASFEDDFSIQTTGLGESLVATFDRHTQSVREIANAARLATPDKSAAFRVLAQASIDRWAGLHCVTWHPLVAAENREAFENGPDGVRIIEKQIDGKHLPATARDSYLPGLIIGTPKTLRYSRGADVAVDPDFSAAVEHAISTGEPALTGRIKWKPDSRQGFGVAMIHPVPGGDDAAEIAGVVVGFFELESLIRPDDNKFRWQGVHLRVTDNDASADSSLLFSNRESPPAKDPFRHVRHYQMSNRHWTLVFMPGKERQATASGTVRTSSWVLSLGMIMTALLGCMFVLGIGREATIQQQVDHQERELDRVNQTLAKQLDRLRLVDRVLDRERNLLRTLIDMLPSQVYVTDLEGRFLINNAAHLKMLELADQESAIGMTLTDLGWPGGEASLNADLAAIESGVGQYEHEEQIRNRDGSLAWKLNTRLPLRDGDDLIAGIVAVSHDVTDRKKIQQSLVQTEQRMRLALKSARAGTWNWRIHNDQFTGDRFLAPILHCLPDASVRCLDDFLAHVHADDRQHVRTRMEMAAAEESSLETEFRVQTVGSEIAYIAVRGQLETDEMNRQSVLAGVCWDITREKRAELALVREQHLLTTLVEHAPDVIYFKNRESRFIRVNQATVEYIGLEDETQLIGKTDHDFFEARYAKNARADEEAIMATGKPIVGREEREESVDGSVRWVLTTKLPLYDEQGEIIGTCGLSRDITPIKKQSELLADRKKELETLLHISSHDLREPMNSILNFSHRLQQRAGDQFDPESLDFLQRIIGGAERMNALLIGVADMFLAQTSISPDEVVAGRDLIQPALDALADEIESSGAAVTLSGSFPEFFVDRKWAEKAIYELISNALKFVSKEKTAEIEISPWQAGNEFGFVVADRGPGVRPQHARNIFNLFKRTVGRHIVGTGAGLAIVAQVAKQHQGRVWVEPRDGGGSQFFLTLAATPTVAIEDTPKTDSLA